MLQTLYKDVSPILISRFGDRETLVKTEIWSTYVLLLNQTALSGHNRALEGDSPSAGLKRKRDGAQEMTLDGTPSALLSSQVPQLAKQLLGQLKGNRVPPNVLQEGFRLLTALLSVIPGALSSQTGAIINLSSSVLSQPVSTGTASLHLGVLSFLKLFFSAHSPSTFGPSLPKITPMLLNILSQRHPRVISETHRVFSALLKSLRPVKQTEWAEKVYSDALQRLMTNDTDAQVRQCAENCIGELCVCAPDVVQNKGNKEWEAILRSTDRTENPIKVVNYVAKEGTISDEWVNGCVTWLMNVLKKGGRQGKVEAFSCLEILIRR
jgi:cullin-associated NEDD8-dissociated protein 1